MHVQVQNTHEVQKNAVLFVQYKTCTNVQCQQWIFSSFLFCFVVVFLFVFFWGGVVFVFLVLVVCLFLSSK